VIGTFEVGIDSQRSVYYNSCGEFTGRVLYWQGIWAYEKETTPLFFSLAQSAGVFLDIGAHTGLYTLLAMAANQEIQIYTFEPVPSLCKQLKLNVALNQSIESVTVEKAVIAAQCAEKVPFFILSQKISASSLRPKPAFIKDRDLVETIFVKSYSLDAYVKLNNIQKVDLIKIDVEGSELDVLQGAQKVLGHHRPIIICEILPRNSHIFPNIERILQTTGYEYALITPNGLIKQDSLGGDRQHYWNWNFLLWPTERSDVLKAF
jgi:FkbM family methyltransferase